MFRVQNFPSWVLQNKQFENKNESNEFKDASHESALHDIHVY